MKTKIEIRECSWVNGKAFKWQGHIYLEGHPFAEPLISGMPQMSAPKAKASLWKAVNGYKDLINGAEVLVQKRENLKQKREEWKAKAEEKKHAEPAGTGKKKTTKTKKEK